MSDKNPLKPRTGAAKTHESDPLSAEDAALVQEIEKLAGKPEGMAMVQIQASLRMAKALEEMSAAVLDMADMLEGICAHFHIDQGRGPDGGETPLEAPDA